MLVDLWMPTFTPHLLRRLRMCSPRSVIVVVSAHARDESARAIEGIAGIASVVSKRASPETIVAAVSTALLAVQQPA